MNISQTAIKNRWLFWLLLLVFVVAKIPHLQYGFYWDESWVYGPAIYLMHAHSPSLLPGAIPLDYSRGHPLLFQAACAGWMDIFGSTRTSMHCFALCISVALAVVIYEVMLRLFNYRTALLASCLLLANPYFFAHSSFLLTDISVGLFALLGIYCYFKERYWLAGIMFTLLFLIKESGWVMCIVLIADMLVAAIILSVHEDAQSTLYREIPPSPLERAGVRLTKQSILKRLPALLLPLVFLGIFFVVQKSVYGWFLYPGHTSAINLDINNTLANLQASLAIAFYGEGELYDYLLLLFILTGTAIAYRKWRSLLWLLYAALAWAAIRVLSSKDIAFYVFISVSMVGIIVLYVKQLPAFSNHQQRFIGLVAAFSIVFLLFCCVNFYEPRYLLPFVFFVSVILLSVVFDKVLPAARFLLPVVVLAILAIGITTISTTSVEMTAYRRMDVQQHLVDYCEQHNFYDKHISCKTFFEHIHLADPKTGFLHSGRAFNHVTDTINSQTQLVIYDNIDTGWPELSKEEVAQIKDHALSLLYSYRNGADWVLVYSE